MRKHFGWLEFLAAVGVVALTVPVMLGVLTTPPLRAQAPAVVTGRPKFDAASVKPIKPGEQAGGGPMLQPGGRLTLTTTLSLAIALAYQPIQRFELSGMPDWASSERFDIEAKAEGNPSNQQMWLMLQALLADRFKLVVHREVRQLPVYALVLAKGEKTGPQLRPHTDDSRCIEIDPLPQTPPPGTVAPNTPLPTPYCGGLSGAPALGRLAAQKITLDLFGRALSGQLGRMVIDRTGLNGTFDLTLEWTPLQQIQPASQPDANGAAPDPSSGPPSIFTAVQEQLGLKLEPQTGPVNALVIDHVEEPSPN